MFAIRKNFRILSSQFLSSEIPVQVSIIIAINFSMFDHYPDLRAYFKGAEKFTSLDVQNSDRFAKQGTKRFSSNFKHLEFFVKLWNQYKIGGEIWIKFEERKVEIVNLQVRNSYLLLEYLLTRMTIRKRSEHTLVKQSIVISDSRWIIHYGL